MGVDTSGRPLQRYWWEACRRGSTQVVDPYDFQLGIKGTA